jgi:hypothetical protein
VGCVEGEGIVTNGGIIDFVGKTLDKLKCDGLIIDPENLSHYLIALKHLG